MSDLIISKASKENKADLYSLRELLINHQNKVNSDNPNNEKKINNSNKLIDTYLEKDNSIFLIASKKKQATGFIHGTIDPNPESGYLQDLYVIESERNQGIGSTLIEELNKWFKKRGVKFYGLTTDNTKDNQATLTFYRNKNYTVKKEDGKIIYLYYNLDT